MLGFYRIAAAVPNLELANPSKNVTRITEIAAKAERKSAAVVLFPELCLTGATCADLFRQSVLLEEAENKLIELAKWSKFHTIVLVVGLPVRLNGSLYNCAAVVAQGNIKGLIPQNYFPCRCENDDRRWFSSGESVKGKILFAGQEIPFGSDLLFTAENLTFGIEVGDDLNTPLPPSCNLALNGANLILNPTLSTEGVGRAEWRRNLVRQQSERLCAAYVYVSAGLGESTTDGLCGGHALIAENGELLCESKRFIERDTLLYADIDTQKLAALRCSEQDFSALPRTPCQTFPLPIPERIKSISREIDPHPFVPAAPAELIRRCEEIFEIQSNALARRLDHVGAKSVVIGLSGGLDSALALLVAEEAADLLDWKSKDVIALSMPGFGTSDRTRKNAQELAEALGVTFREIDITAACHQHFADIGHDPEDCNTTFENAQARERTQILMNIANRENGLLVGTGDLSEIALGWCTFNADHISMYNVNCDVPKTLIRELVRWSALNGSKAKRETLLDILDTPVSPELLPRKSDGSIQNTEAIIGPYELHDFFLYHAIRYGAAPDKILALAQIAFDDIYRLSVIRDTLKIFCNRFFRNQFKRSCSPDGPKVGTISLSARMDWRMPSDANPDLWLSRI